VRSGNGAARNDASNIAKAELLKTRIDNRVEADSRSSSNFQHVRAALMTATGALSLVDIDRLIGGRLGRHDVACPLCGPSRRDPANRRRKVLRIWRLDRGFAGYHCARCGENGSSRDPSTRRPDPAVIERARAEAAKRERLAAAERLSKARWLWSQRQPIVGSIAERYLREARGHRGALPPTIGFLPGRDGFAPAMIAAFGFAREIEPGVITIDDDAVHSVHLTRLLPDGSDRERGDQARIMVARSMGLPIVIAPPNDLLGLAITEGIEDALSAHQATGLGVWAAGSGSRMPALADAVPDHMEAVTIYAHDDDTGQRGAHELAEELDRRDIEVFIEGLDNHEAAA
jgi:hypothetical protein